MATAEVKLPCPDAAKFAVVDRLAAHLARAHQVITIDGARVQLDNGWFLVRASNTTPCLTVRVEGPDLAAVRAASEVLEAALATEAEVDRTPLPAAVAALG